MFIVLEGPDGGGKTSVIEEVKKALPGAAYFVDPGGTKFGQQMRSIIKDPNWKLAPLTLFYMFAASRNELAKEIIDAMDDGKTVICDRWTLSTYCYQTLCGIPEHLIDEIMAQLPMRCEPDSYIYLRCSNTEFVKRRKIVPGEIDRFEEKGLNFRSKLLDEYDKRTRAMGNRCRTINTDMFSSHIPVAALVTEHINKLIGTEQ